MSRSGSAGVETEDRDKKRDPPSAEPGTLNTPLKSFSFFLTNLCSKPALPHPHTYRKEKKNCHGVFHQLPTKGSSLRLLPRGTPPTKPQTRAHFVQVFFLLLFISSRELVCAIVSGGRLKSTGGQEEGVGLR